MDNLNQWIDWGIKVIGALGVSGVISALVMHFLNRDQRQHEQHLAQQAQQLEHEHQEHEHQIDDKKILLESLATERTEAARLRAENKELRDHNDECEKCITGLRILSARRALEISMYRNERQHVCNELSGMVELMKDIEGLGAVVLDIRQTVEHLKTDIVVPDLEMN